MEASGHAVECGQYSKEAGVAANAAFERLTSCLLLLENRLRVEMAGA